MQKIRRGHLKRYKHELEIPSSFFHSQYSKQQQQQQQQNFILPHMLLKVFTTIEQKVSSPYTLHVFFFLQLGLGISRRPSQNG